MDYWRRILNWDRQYTAEFSVQHELINHDMTGSQLNKILGLNARHALYRQTGDWYHQLNKFPGILFDQNGYFIVKSQKDYYSNKYLQRKADLHINGGISSLTGYRKFSVRDRTKINELQQVKSQKTNELLPAIQKKIVRIVYNSNGWTMPSGWKSKSTNKKTFEGKFGFGYDEWLFNFDFSKGKFQYGFIQGFYNGFDKHQGKVYDVQLYSIDAITKTKFWVGRIKKCYVLTNDEHNELLKSKGSSYRACIQHLKSVGLYNQKVRKEFKHPLPCVKFKKSDVILYDPLIPIISDKFMKNKGRYKVYDWNLSVDRKTDMNKDFVFRASRPNSKISVIRSAARSTPTEIRQVHRQIATGLYFSLLQKSKKENIACDCSTGSGTYIDMVHRLSNGDFILYEIKTFRDIRKNVREAFGQLMEYAYWTSLKNVKRLIIVSDVKSTEQLNRYFSFIRKRFHLPLFYQQFDLEKGELSERT